MKRKFMFVLVSVLMLSLCVFLLNACDNDESSADKSQNSSNSTQISTSISNESASIVNSTNSNVSDSTNSNISNSTNSNVSDSTNSNVSDSTNSNVSNSTNSNVSASNSANSSVSNSASVKKFTITFNANGHGTAPTEQLIVEGEKATAPTAPSAEGFDFDGWFKESSCTNEWIFGTQTVSQNQTLFAKWTAQIKVVSIEILSISTHKTSFAKGIDFSDNGLLIQATYENSTTATLNSTNYIVDSSDFDKTQEGTYSIVIRLSTNSQITTSYDVNVTAAEFSAIAISQSSTHQTNFVIGEKFNSTGLKVNKVYTDSTTQELLPSTYTISSTEYNNKVVGNKTINITLNDDNLKTTNYVVKVENYTFNGEYYTPNHVIPQLVNFRYKLDQVAKCYGFNSFNSTYQSEGDEFEIIRNAEGKMQTSIDGEVFVYDSTTDSMECDGKTYYHFNTSTSVKLSGITEESAIYFIIPKNGSLTEDTLSTIQSIGYDIFTDEEHTENVTEETVFSTDTTIYTAPVKRDYRGKPFIGTYYDDFKEVIYTLNSDGTATYGNHTGIPYEATESETKPGDYNILLEDENYIFDASDNSLNYTFEDYTEKYKQKTSTQLIVSLTLSEEIKESGNSLAGDYVIDANSPFSLILRNKTKVELEGYTAGTPISTNQSFVIKSFIRSNVYLNSNNIFGTYLGGYFDILNNNSITFYPYNGTKRETNYEVTDLTENCLLINFDFGTAFPGNFEAKVYSNKFEISTGSLQGTYYTEQMFKGCPFIGKFSNGNNSFEIFENGNATHEIINEEMHEQMTGRVEINSVGEYIYHLNFIYLNDDYNEETDSLTINMKLGEKLLTIGCNELECQPYLGEKFVGSFGNLGDIITIDNDGTVIGLTGGQFFIAKVEISTTGYILKIREDNTTPTEIFYTLEYNMTTDTIVYNSKTYSKVFHFETYNLSFDYTSLVFKSYTHPDVKWEFTNYYHYISINSDCIGRIIEFNDDNFKFCDNSNNISVIDLHIDEDLKEYSFEYNGVKYVAELPIAFSTPFANHTYSNNNINNITIRINDSVEIYFDDIGYIDGTVENIIINEGIYTITIKIPEAENQIWTFNENDNSFTSPDRLIFN